jgi:hypothetical protein
MAGIIFKNSVGSELPTPEVGQSLLYVDSSTGGLKIKGSEGSESSVGSGAGLPAGATSGTVLVYDGEEWLEAYDSSISDKYQFYIDHSNLQADLYQLNSIWSGMDFLTPDFKRLRAKKLITPYVRIDSHLGGQYSFSAIVDTTLQDIFYSADLVDWKAKIDAVTTGSGGAGTGNSFLYNIINNMVGVLTDFQNTIDERILESQASNAQEASDISNAIPGIQSTEQPLLGINEYWDSAIHVLEDIRDNTNLLQFKTDFIAFKDSLVVPS